MKLARLIDERLHSALTKLSSEPLPLKTAFRLKGITKIAREEYSKYEEVRKEALVRHGLKNEDGSLKVNEHNNVQFSDEGIKAFASELNDLTNMEIELPTLSVGELGDKIVLSAEELEVLEGIIVE
jgi:hypothetical protein